MLILEFELVTRITNFKTKVFGIYMIISTKFGISVFDFFEPSKISFSFIFLLIVACQSRDFVIFQHLFDREMLLTDLKSQSTLIFTYL